MIKKYTMWKAITGCKGLTKQYEIKIILLIKTKIRRQNIQKMKKFMSGIV